VQVRGAVLARIPALSLESVDVTSGRLIVSLLLLFLIMSCISSSVSVFPRCCDRFSGGPEAVQVFGFPFFAIFTNHPFRLHNLFMLVFSL